LLRYGRPIRYGYVDRDWPLSAYQTVFAPPVDRVRAGSAEMPSAARPFSETVVTRLVASGIVIAPVVLHTGVASPEAHEKPYPERFGVPGPSARLVNEAHRAGGRVIAVGTTAVRALESAADPQGQVHACEGWTDLVVTRATGVKVVDGLLTGFHEPAASHLAMLETVAGGALLRSCYERALDEGYLWHEFGDVNLLLP
jgi:S-adenosylmethionine:tRNA ribosyltransferase-isomerase